MNDLYHMNLAMQYIEDHLSEEIDYKKLAQIAMTSEMYFKRLFSFLSGMPLSEYIRNRRLTQAAFELKTSEIKVIDLALKYGYTSPDAFTKAFNQLHGVTPSSSRDLQSNIKSYPMLTFRLDIQGGNPMNYKLIEKEPFTVAGYGAEVVVNSECESQDINSFLNSLTEEHYAKLNEISNGQFDKKILYVSSDYEEKNNTSVQDFYVGVTVDQVPEDLKCLTIPKQTWAVFTISGEWEEVNDTWTRIYTEWFPSSTYEPADSPEFMVSSENQSEVWVAVR
ncbi:MAG: AraC family transcriptional regulator [Alkalibacterium sp.]|nr:AraC family transcriptional regulator [Alkalibacterium sp.]